MDLSDLLFSMRKRNIHFFLSNGKLKLKYPREDNVNDLLGSIKSHKNDLIQLIETNKTYNIPKMNEKKMGGVYPVSSRQFGLYFIHVADKKSTIYNVLAVSEVVGKLDINALNFSINNVIECHDAYRTSFRLDKNGNPRQVIHDEVQFELDVMYANDKEVEELILKEEGHPFDLTQAPLLRVKLFIVNENRHVLLFNHHHIITDSLSINMFMKNVFLCYENVICNRKVENDPPPISYADFSIWDINQLKGIAFESRVKYWKRYLYDPFDCFLPNQINDSSVIMSQSSYVGFEFDKELTESLLIFFKQEKTTFYAVLLSALYLVFGKFYNKKDLIISTQYANRDHPDLENVLGYFTTKLLIRNQLEDELSISQFIKEVARNFSVVMDNCLPYDHQVSVLRENGILNISDFADVSLNLLLGNPSSIINLSGITINPYYDSVHNKFNTLSGGPSGLSAEGLGFTIRYDNNQVYGCCSFSSALFSQHTVECIIKHYKYVLNQMILHPELLLKNITLLSPKEYHKIVYDWNKTEAPYPNNKTIHQVFEEQVAKKPNNIALVFEGEKMNYQTLNKKSNQLARFISAQYELIHDEPIQPGALITLCLERSFDMIVAILAVLKSGAAYVPINPEFPQSRIQFIVNDTKSSMILTQSNLQEKLEQSLFSDNAKDLSHSCRLIFLDNKPYAEEYQDNLQVSSKSIDLAYIIYTSGTTGNPKGVMIEHRNIIVHAAAMAERLDIQSNDVFGTLSSPDVDSGNTAIYVVLLFGYTLSIIPKYCLLDVNKLINVVKRDKISFYKIVPTLLDGLLDNRNSIYDLRSLLPSKTLILGGSELKNELLDKIKRLNPKINIMNHYGPTEATVGAMTAFMNDNMKIVIGTPLNNYSGYILDKYLNTLPIGAIGELYIGRAGLARGYLNQPELTQERFIENPFATPSDIEKGYTRLYKSGDLARWLPCGNIEYIGRNDFQVKMLGFRIELGEIESALLNIHGIKQSVVLAKRRELGGNQSQYLVAYYSSDHVIEDEALLESLKASLPDYMIPSLFVHLQALPLTTNGKVDRQALPDPEFSGNLDQYEAPRNDLEQQLCDIWQSLLNLEQVGIHDDFFRLGGHSILAIQLVHKIEQLCHKHVAVADIFKHKTISKIVESMGRELTPFSVIKSLSENNQHTPLLCVHPSQAGCEVYYPFVDLLSDHYHVIGIDHYPMMSGNYNKNLSDLAVFYVENIMSSQYWCPTNFYSMSLLGWSMGGQIALEMALVLEEIGFDSIKVVLLDSFIRNKNDDPSVLDYCSNEKKLMKYHKDYGIGDHQIQSYRKTLHYEFDLASTPLSGVLKKSDIKLFQAMKKNKNSEEQIKNIANHVVTPIQQYSCDCDHFSIINHIVSNPVDQSHLKSFLINVE